MEIQEGKIPEDVTCQRTIHMTAFWGKAGTRKCGKKATHKQLDGLPVCEHHYNKLMKKINKRGLNPAKRSATANP